MTTATLTKAALAAGLLLGGVAALAQADGDDEPFAWENDFAAARQKAKESERPLLVVFR